MKRLLFILTTVVAAVAAMTTTGAAASTSTTVDFVGRAFQSDGQVTVPAGSTVTLQTTWTAKNLGQVKAFLQDVTVTASVGSTQITNANSYLGAPKSPHSRRGLLPGRRSGPIRRESR